MKRNLRPSLFQQATVLLVGFLFAVAPVLAQYTGPGWVNISPWTPDSGDSTNSEKQTDGGVVPLAMQAPSQDEGGGEPEPLATGFGATEATPSITELARGLKNDPIQIYQYVRNHIDFEPYFGSMKGAAATYLDGSGNDFDQASLMIALIRAGGGTAQYAYGAATIPISNAANWLGVTNGATSVSNMFASGGLPAPSISGANVIVTHVWVRVTSGGNVYLFDPSYKQYEYRGGMDLATAMGYNRTTLLQAATNGAEVSADYVRNISESGIRSELLKYSTNLVAQLRSGHPNDDVLTILGGRQIIPEELQSLPAALPYSATQAEAWDSIPSNYVHQVRIQYGTALDAKFNLPELNGARLAITFAADDNTILGQNLLTNALVSEGFEGSFPSGWSVGDANSAGTPAYWGRVASGFAGVTSPSGGYMGYCAGYNYSTANGGPNYRNKMTAYMQRTVDLSGYGLATLTFKSFIPSMEVVANTDSCRIRVSTNGGTSWTTLWNVDRVDSVWTSETLDLSTYAGNSSVLLRFEFVSDDSGADEAWANFVGWFVDNIALVGTQGDKFDRASGIARDTDVPGTISVSGELDVYRVRLRAGGSYTITVPATGSLVDPEIWLFNPGETQLSYNDDASGMGLGSKITYNCTVTGDYYVQVGGNTGTGTYTLHVAEGTSPAPVMPATLWKDDSSITQENANATTHATNLTITITHPYFPASYGSNASQQVSYPLVRGGTYAIIRGFGGGDAGRLLRTRQRQLEAYRAQNLSSASREVVTETLNIIGQTWIDETSLARKLIDRVAGANTMIHHRFGLMAQESGYYVDVKAQMSSMVTTNSALDYLTVLKTRGMFQSAMEHAVLEQLQGTNHACASTVKLLKLANQNGKKIYLANTSNYNARVRSALQYTATEKSSFSNLLVGGAQLLLPETNSIALNQWAGSAYMWFSPSTSSVSWVSMVIGGHYYGGYSGDPVPVDTDGLSQYNQPVLLTGATEYHNVSQEPVDLVTGAYLSNHADLSLGGAEPRGLHFARQYNSDQGNSSSVLGYGWTHSYDISIQTGSDYSSGLGLRSPVDAAPVMVAIYAALDLARNANTAQGWTTAILANQWATDQITDNARNVMMGNKVLTYVRMPDGTFSAPPGVTTALALSNDLYRLTERMGTHYDFGSNLHLSSWVDADGNSMSFQYNASTNLSSVSDCFNRQLTFTYTSNLLTSVSHGGTPSRSVSYGYSAAGDLTQFTDPEGFVWTHNYASLHRMVSLYDPTQQLTATNIYDSVGHVMTQKNGFGNAWNFYFSDYRNIEEDPQGGQKVYCYDDKRRLTSSELVAGSPSFVFYDGQDHVVATVDPLGRPTWMLYDGNQNLTNLVDALTNRMVYTYDSQNRLTSAQDPAGGITRFGFDSKNHLTNVVDAAGNLTTYTYCSSGASNGLPARVVAPGNVISASSYDSYGNVAGVTRTDAGTIGMQFDITGNMTQLTDANGGSTRFTFDKRRLNTSVRDPLNNTVSNVFNAAGLRIRSVDALGRTNTFAYTPTYNLAFARFPNGGMVTNTFDNRDLNVRVTDVRGCSISNTFDTSWRRVATTDPLGNRSSVGLDAASNPYTATNALGHVTATTFDPLNRPVVVTDPLQRQWLTAYDARGVVANATDAKGRTTTFASDALGRRTGVTYPSGRAEGFAHDAYGRLAAFTNSEGHVYRMAYDGQGRLLAATNGAGEQVFRNYFDPAGNLTNHVDGAGRSARSQFDADNRCTNTVYADGTAEAFTFDAAGNLLTARNAATTNQFGYDLMNRLISSTARVAGVSLAVVYGRDLAGNVTNIVYPGGNTVRYTLDPNGLVTNVTDWAGHTWRLTRDAGGRTTALAYPNGVTGTWGYDAGNTVTNWSYSGNAALPGRKITRDTMGLKTREDVTSGSTPHPTSNRRAVNTFDAADRLTCATVGTGTNPVVETYRYDLCGALTNIAYSGGGTSLPSAGYTFDLAGRMTSASTWNLSLAATFDAIGNRVKTTINGATRFWVIDHTDPLKRPLMETDTNGAPVRYYVWGGGRLLAAIDADGTTRFAHADETGNIVALTAVDGSVLFTAAYGPYGEPWGTTGTNVTPFAWLGNHGVFQAGGTTLYLTRHRAYDTTMKRWLSQDPMGIAGGVNLYGYGNGNPLAYIDPLGLWSWSQTFGVVRAVGGVFETIAGIGLGAATSWTGIGAVGGGFVALHGIDQIQAGIRQAFYGGRVDSATSLGLQAAGMSPTAANLTDAGISIVGSFGAGYATASIRASQIVAADPTRTAGLTTMEVLDKWEDGSQALWRKDWVALGGEASPQSTVLQRAEMMEQGLDMAGNAYQVESGLGAGIVQGTKLALGVYGSEGMGLTPLAYYWSGVFGAGLGGIGNGLDSIVNADANHYSNTGSRK